MTALSGTAFALILTGTAIVGGVLLAIPLIVADEMWRKRKHERESRNARVVR